MTGEINKLKVSCCIKKNKDFNAILNKLGTSNNVTSLSMNSNTYGIDENLVNNKRTGLIVDTIENSNMLHTLKVLDLSDNNIFGKGGNRIANLLATNSSALVKLDLKDTVLTRPAMKAIGRALKTNTRLESLNLNDVYDGGF
eukprot:gene24132-2403_t